MSTANPEIHPFEPFLPQRARMLFLGSFPPPAGRWSIPFYYPNWINDFWRIMGLIHYGDKDRFCIAAEKRFDEKAIRAFCEEAGLAFYDTACEARRLRDNASDAYLEVVEQTDLKDLLKQIPYCAAVISTGQKSAEIVAEQFGCGMPSIGVYIEVLIEGGRVIRFWRMPSTSRAYPLPLQKKAEFYRRLFE